MLHKVAFEGRRERKVWDFMQCFTLLCIFQNVFCIFRTSHVFSAWLMHPRWKCCAAPKFIVLKISCAVLKDEGSSYRQSGAWEKVYLLSAASTDNWTSLANKQIKFILVHFKNCTWLDRRTRTCHTCILSLYLSSFSQLLYHTFAEKLHVLCLNCETSPSVSTKVWVSSEGSRSASPSDQSLPL